MTARTRRNIGWSPMLLMLLAAWGLWMWNLGAPWFGHHDANGVWISLGARNLSRDGFSQVGFIPAVNLRPSTEGEYTYYTHHPPFIVWAAWLNTSLFGSHEFAVRWGSAASSLISMAALYVLVRRMANSRWALIAVAAYTFVPMMLFFGRMANHEPFALAEILLYLALLIDWMRRPRRYVWLGMAGLVVLGIWTAWAAPFVMGIATAAVLVTASPSRRVGLVSIGAVAVSALTALLISYMWTSPGTLDDLVQAFGGRASESTDFYAEEALPFTASMWIMRQLADLMAFLTPTVLVIGVLGIPGTFRRMRTDTRSVYAGLLIAGFLYMLILRNAAYEHEFYKIYLLPPLAISTAGLLDFLLIARRSNSVTTRRRARLWLAGIMPLIVISLGWSFVLTARLQNFSDTGAYALALSVREHTQPGDLILTNLPATTNALQYYAGEPIVAGTDAGGALNLLAQTDRTVLYVHCGESMPTELLTYPINQGDQCDYVRLR